MKFNSGLKRGQVISNAELVSVFECGNMGGMRRSHKTNTLVIVSDYTKGLYQDKWKGDVLHYTGMGKKGDQDINHQQNRTLNESKTNGVEVFLFEVLKKKEYTFIGEVILCGQPYQARQLDEENNIRNVWVFPLRVKENLYTIDEGLVTMVKEEVELVEVNDTIETTEKLLLIKSRVGHGELKKRLLKQEAKCKICGLSNEKFLIASHIKPWHVATDQERLDINNVLLLCPSHDAAFDKGYISFHQDGTLCISSKLGLETRALMNLVEGSKVELKEQSKKYMQWHQKNMFRP